MTALTTSNKRRTYSKFESDDASFLSNNSTEKVDRSINKSINQSISRKPTVRAVSHVARHTAAFTTELARIQFDAWRDLVLGGTAQRQLQKASSQKNKTPFEVQNNHTLKRIASHS
jgi:hypothetical protein